MNRIKQNVFPLLAALIWGTAFSSQAICSDNGMGPFTFNALRGVTAFVTLLVFSFLFPSKRKKLTDKKYLKELVIGGAFCGIALFAATNLQQAAFKGTDSGKVGFITVLYVVIIPIAGLFQKKKLPVNVWISIAISLVGMYFLFFKGGGIENVNIYDLFALLCAFAYALQILFIDRFASKVDGIHLSCVQFFFVALLSSPPAVLTESPSADVVFACITHVLYVGVFSSSIAYTLQIIAQKDSNPTVVSLLLSLESVFSAISGAIVRSERLHPLEYLGCAIMFSAVILSQIPFPQKKKKD